MNWRVVAAAVFPLLLVSATVRAEEPGRGLTAAFEQEYLKSIMDHHFSALRMTELAAGTDVTRDPAISPEEGTSPTPEETATEPKATLEMLRSLARANNRVQREEILAAQGFLRDWYGIEYEPRLRQSGKRAIEALEKAAAGDQFNVKFMEVVSRHHFIAAEDSLACVVAVELEHHELERYCQRIIGAQVSDIQDMREWLCRFYEICDYQPLSGIAGRHQTGQEP